MFLSGIGLKARYSRWDGELVGAGEAPKAAALVNSRAATVQELIWTHVRIPNHGLVKRFTVWTTVSVAVR